MWAVCHHNPDQRLTASEANIDHKWRNTVRCCGGAATPSRACTSGPCAHHRGRKVSRVLLSSVLVFFPLCKQATPLLGPASQRWRSHTANEFEDFHTSLCLLHSSSRPAFESNQCKIPRKHGVIAHVLLCAPNLLVVGSNCGSGLRVPIVSMPVS